MGRLRHSDPHAAGIERRRRGRGFSYHYCGIPVRDADVLARIRALVIPPAWERVWICPDEDGHLQAAGFDAAGRRQYRYHDRWRLRRDAAKFNHMLVVAQALPALRRQVALDLSRRTLCRERVLGGAARLLDQAVIRIGGEGYAQDDPVLGEATFGLATLLRTHASVNGPRVTLCFAGKGGAEFTVTVADRALATLVRRLLDRDDPNPELLAYRNGVGWKDVRTADVNDYLREAARIELTAKDFRTWHGTVAAAISLATAAPPRSETAGRRAIAQSMRDVAGILGNTPAVVRKSYVDPHLVDAFRGGETINWPAGTDVATTFADRTLWRLAESRTLRLLVQRHGSSVATSGSGRGGPANGDRPSGGR